MCIKISPSLLACNFSNLFEEVFAMQHAGAEMIHLDVMDGHFVPNISMGPCVFAPLRKQVELLFDVHLMISDPLFYIEDYVKAGADLITFHTECDSDIQNTIDKIRSFDKKVGLAIKPNTPFEEIEPWLSQIDMALVMTVEPGFGGQKFMEQPVEKIRQIAAYKQQHGLKLDIQVDGGISTQTAPTVCAAGANVLVAGSALFSKEDYCATVAELRQSAQQAYSSRTI